MLVAMAKDIRVLLIKLADRLHNMRTIASLPEFKQRRIAQETLDIYAPLAHRLGIADVKWQLEDTAFAVLYPQRYAEIEQMVATQAPERDDLLETRAHRVARAARGAAHRSRRHRPAEALLVDLREDGHAGQAVRRGPRPRRRAGRRRVGEGLLRRARLHPRDVAAGAGPLQGLHRDAQVQPLPVAAHDRRRARRARPVEVQIRTQEMHRRAEYGIAAHWGYKEREPRRRPHLAPAHGRLAAGDHPTPASSWSR